MSTTKKSSRPVSPDFTDIILRAYFGERVPARALAAAIRRLDLQSAGFDSPPYSELDAAVAEVLLKSVRDALPQWAEVRDGEVTLGRRQAHRLTSRRRYRPSRLFTINWADSGPGFSWPMSYYATLVGWAKRVVITASADGTDAYGWTDFAIGHFPFDKGLDTLDRIRQVVVADWSQQAANGQGRWAYLFDEALVSGEVAEAWANQVPWEDDEVADA